ncbi:nuclease-related domain-containing protein [Bacillus sp. 7894-2]|uniref:nuclease-related domain-containing protein n=1 Tax=Bacillus sp. 7894-2 TaxID=2021695 RepID=UPI000BA61790|nr:nuclease-related domain-containing protein [Bacillus sp. 7894-2]PAE23867.1 NERD nuclease [Bacillus sp. 7894-2]
MIPLISFFKKRKDEEQQNPKITLDQIEEKKTEKVATRIGELGEYKIDIQLHQLPKDFKHLSDLLVENPKAKTGYSQLDHIVITPFGVFVIETKNYQGTIYGGKDRKTWSVNGKFKMMNPFIQNYGHIQALKNFLDQKYHHLFISMVSFTKRCTFKIDDLELRKIASNDLIVYDVELFDYIHRKVSVLKLQHKEPLLNDSEVLMIYDAIYAANIIDPSIREKHVQTLKESKSNKKETVTKENQSEKCCVCNKTVSDKVKAFCLSNKRFNGKIYCFGHQKDLYK